MEEGSGERARYRVKRGEYPWQPNSLWAIYHSKILPGTEFPVLTPPTTCRLSLPLWNWHCWIYWIDRKYCIRFLDQVLLGAL